MHKELILMHYTARGRVKKLTLPRFLIVKNGVKYKVAFAIGTMYYTHIHRTHIVTKNTVGMQ